MGCFGQIKRQESLPLETFRRRGVAVGIAVGGRKGQRLGDWASSATRIVRRAPASGMWIDPLLDEPHGQDSRRMAAGPAGRGRQDAPVERARLYNGNQQFH